MKNSTAAERAVLHARAQQINRSLPPITYQPNGALDQSSHQQVAHLTQTILHRHRAVGASLVLCHPSGVNETFHFGNARLHPSVPVSADTCFRIASVSKLVMTFAVLSLVEEGLLDLDADISLTLGYSVRHPHVPQAPVTLRMLLTHTSSITDVGPYSTTGLQNRASLQELLADPLSWRDVPPGTSFQYSNLGAGVVGVLMERASGQPFETILQTRLFHPLGIRASYDPRRITPASDLANGYSVRGFLFPPLLRYDADALSTRPPEPFDPEHDYLIAAGRMITDSTGLATLIRLLASQDGMGILTPASLQAMRACQDGIHGILSAGRGLNTAFLPDVFSGYSPIGHQGVAYGMCAELFADPQTGGGVGLMINGVRLIRQPPLMQVGFDLSALGFAALSPPR